ncbi:TrkH family potassium uptake protein [Roseovarius sp. SCSIO 43702]|uniref:TrkH family potassium uptake protein n=1 Tax=Roseovarius sp. SCSIO 43702 TaxID=2823043 RepID=UPI001C736B1B|nr:potassium transporter TrkG [Roseovarius sp. SCSIO 43702]QYX55490.1 TrkH family potassium uptake protein [Roseovarius sp. SCSIO 43702]
MIAHLARLPLFLILAAIASLSMMVPALHALLNEDHTIARSFLYWGLIGFVLIGLVGLAISANRERRSSDLANLLSLFMTFTLLPVFLALPFQEALGTTSFLNAYVEMVSSLTTTGATLFADPSRLADSLHLWRGLVGWMGGLLMWVAASAVLAQLNLGGFEVTATAEPGQEGARFDRFERANAAKRLGRAAATLAHVYAGLTMVLWLCLVVGGDRPLVGLVHAMSTMATSGISPVGGLAEARSGVAGEMVIFLFLSFALSRLTFSSDTMTQARPGLIHDPEFRLGGALVLGVPLLLFLRHWIGALDVSGDENLGNALRALWGAAFSVLSFLSTTGFESAHWDVAQGWSGLRTPGLILMGLALVGGGVATTAGGVKLLRVYTLYLAGQREMERLVHPNSVGRAGARSRRIRRQGAFVAWIFFMLFALSLSLVTVLFSWFGIDFENAVVLAIAALSTTGPLITVAAEVPLTLTEIAPLAKLVLAMAMVVGRLETLAIIALLNPGLWRT